MKSASMTSHARRKSVYVRGIVTDKRRVVSCVSSQSHEARSHWRRWQRKCDVESTIKELDQSIRNVRNIRRDSSSTETGAAKGNGEIENDIGEVVYMVVRQHRHA